jgi:hypothetical protein
MRFPNVVVERENDVKGEWTQIPSYLGSLSQRVIAYSLNDPDDPASYDEYSEIYSSPDGPLFNISSTFNLRINRLRKAADYYTPDYEWDGKTHYFTVVLESFYGEKPCMNIVMQMAPMQAMPMITDVKAIGYNNDISGEYFSQITGNMDITGAKIDDTLLFKSELNKFTDNVTGTTFYSPEVDASAKGVQQFTVAFNVTGNNTNNNASRASMLVPGFTVSRSSLGSSVVLTCTNSYFYPLNTIGYLRFGIPGDTSTLKIVKRTANPDGWRYNFPDINVSYTP